MTVIFPIMWLEQSRNTFLKYCAYKSTPWPTVRGLTQEGPTSAFLRVALASSMRTTRISNASEVKGKYLVEFFLQSKYVDLQVDLIAEKA